MNTIDIGEAFRRIVEQGIGAGDESVLDELMAETVIENQRGNHPNREGAKEVSRTLHRWFSDFSLTIQDIAVSGDTVWTRSLARGVNTGNVMGFHATNEPVEVTVFDVGRFENGLMVEHWGCADQLGLLMQTGLDPRSMQTHVH